MQHLATYPLRSSYHSKLSVICHFHLGRSNILRHPQSLQTLGYLCKSDQDNLNANLSQLKMSIKGRKKSILRSLQNSLSLRLCKISLRKSQHKGTLRSNYWVYGRQIFGWPISQRNMAVQFSIWLLYWAERCSADPNKTWRVLTESRIKSQYFPWKSREPQINWPVTVTCLIAMWRRRGAFLSHFPRDFSWLTRELGSTV